jgi:hypothetical protein
MKLTIYTFSFLLLILGCQPYSNTSASTLPDGKRYAIGQGGGFTGDYKEYILSENGKVHKYDFKYDREVYFKTIGKADLIYFMEKIESMSLEGIEMNQPGNMTYYIDVRIGRTSVNKLTWGNHKFYTDKELVKLHKELFENLSKWE